LRPAVDPDHQAGPGRARPISIRQILPDIKNHDRRYDTGTNNDQGTGQRLRSFSHLISQVADVQHLHDGLERQHQDHALTQVQAPELTIQPRLPVARLLECNPVNSNQYSNL